MTTINSHYYSDTEVRDSTRTLSVLSALLFLFFSVVDVWAIESSLTEALIVRGVVVTFLLFSYRATYSPSFTKYSSIIMPLDIVMASAGIEYMILMANIGDHAYSVYFVGLILILMTLYSWTYIKFSIAITITCAVIFGYIYIEQFTRAENAMLSTPELITNLFFIISAVVIGVVARLMRDRFIRENFLLQASLTEALEEKTEEAKDNAHLANHDALTSLANRRYAIELLEQSLIKAKERDDVLVIMFVDLNGFKQINDIYGHFLGDEVLKIIARRLELAVRTKDCLARLGGDEFLIGLLLEKESTGEIENMAEKFCTIISDPLNINGVRLEVSASIGIAAYPFHGNQIRVLMEIADKKMYQIKHKKKEAEVNNVIEADNSNAVVMFPRKIS